MSDPTTHCEHGVALKNRCLKCHPMQIGDHTPDLTPRCPTPEAPLDPLPLPGDSAARKEVPMATGLLDYFPNALAAVARLSFLGNQKHNPGQPLHWSRDKSSDHADCIVRHCTERGTYDAEGNRHSTMLAWRALANLEIELELAHGLPPSRASK